MILGLTACGPDVASNDKITAPATRLTFVGSSTMTTVVAELAQGFRIANPGVEVDLQGGGRARGLSYAD